MKTKLIAAALAALTLGAFAMPAAAQDFGRQDSNYRGEGYRGDRGDDFRGGERNWRRAEITIRNNGREFSFGRDDRLFYRLLDRPFGFRPGLTYAYTDRCNRFGCVAFVFDDYHRRPIDRIFAPHLPTRGYGWRQARGFDGEFRGYGRYGRDDRGWNNSDDRDFRDGRDGRGRDERWEEHNGRGGHDGRSGDDRGRRLLESGPAPR
jgi:hypothetical protein